MTGMMLAAMGAAKPVTVTITPPTEDGADTVDTGFFTPTATVSAGTPSAYSWGVVSGVGGSVTSGGTTASPTLQITDGIQGNGPQVVTFYCDVTVSGVVYRGTAVYSWDWLT